MTDEYDLIVLGGGPVGENVADRAVQGGLTAVIVESELVGGECSYWACMPSKALLRSPQALRAAQHVGGAAEAVTGALDVRAVLDRGRGRLSGERQVTVTAPDGSERVLTARHAVAISTGSDAAIPPIPGLRDAQPWTSREATSTEEIPASLVVLGGGVVAVEMATAYASLGATVTVLARSGLLGSVEPFAAELVADGLRELGVDVRTGVATLSVARDGDGVTVQTDGGEVRAAEILVATGRTPRSRDIGLEVAGLEPGRSIGVDETLRVPGSDWLYAVGDVNGRVLLTHQGKYQARAAGDAIAARAKGETVDDAPWGRFAATADHAAVPQVVFSEPEVAAVGLTEAAAREAGRRIRAVDVEFSSVAGAGLHADDYRGKARMVVDEDRQVLLGVTFAGPDVAELIHAATVAVAAEVPLARLWHAVPSYPTMSEVWLRLLEEYGRDSA
jgi:pyruvate/2-oxoglutarate dehydrogenase complex dihydrolipoamide dehydrogenase (E3) component